MGGEMIIWEATLCTWFLSGSFTYSILLSSRKPEKNMFLQFIDKETKLENLL